jgi:NAD(P)H-dependent nitrite reductase small subunit
MSTTPMAAHAPAGWTPICALEDIPPDTGVAALVQGAQVAVFRLADGRVYALGNRDPYSGANVLARGITGDLQGEPVVASPVYKQHFSLATGRCIEEPEIAVASYPVRLVEGRIEVRAGSAGAPGRPRLVVVGGGLAALRTLEELLRLAPERYDITLFSAEREPGYNRVLLSSLLAGDRTRADLAGHGADWFAARGIRLQAGDPVVAIDRARRTVRAASGLEVHYDRLLLATGSEPYMPPLAGCDLHGVQSFRDLDDVGRMLEAAANEREAVVIGGGVLGIEAAHGLLRRGMSVTLVHVKPHLMERALDDVASALLAARLESHGLRLRLGAGVERLLGERTGGVCAVRLAGGEEIPATLVVIATGIVPNVRLARAAGLPCGRGLRVNDTLQSFDPRIYAVGECVQHRGATYGLVAPIFEQARVCANHLAGRGIASYRGSISSTTLKVNGVDLFSAGEVSAPAGARELVYRDAAGAVYRKLVVREGRLLGALSFGDGRDSAWYLELMQQGADVGRYGERLLFGKRYADEQAA